MPPLHETVLLLGDFNLSYNLHTHRPNPSTPSALKQDEALHSLLTQGGLQEVCDIPHTWNSSTTWSTSDHITISTNTSLTTHSAYRDTTPWEASLSDHALIGVTLTSFGKVHNSRRRTPFPRFRKDKETEYAEGVASLLVDTPPLPHLLHRGLYHHTPRFSILPTLH